MAQKQEEREDLRVRRTRRALQQALIDLTVEKGFSAISVRDITERAMVNRSTFYRHYLGKCELVEQYMHEIYEVVHELVDQGFAARQAGKPEDKPAGLNWLIAHIDENADFYRVMLGLKGDPHFTEDFRQNIEKIHRRLAELKGSADPNSMLADMRISYSSYASVGAIVWWLENDRPCTRDQLIDWLSQLTNASASMPTATLSAQPAGF